MGIREVSVVEVREVLPAWLDSSAPIPDINICPAPELPGNVTVRCTLDQSVVTIIGQFRVGWAVTSTSCR